MMKADQQAAASLPIIADVSAAQRAASDPRESVWVSAAAGSGKTKVLADRVTRLLLDDVRPERILCLTFTRAAAAEMSIRLTQRLSRWATCDTQALEKELADLQGFAADEGTIRRARRLFALVLACPGGMRIQTIHGFAQEILRRFPLEAGLAPHFTVMEESDAAALWREAFDELLASISAGAEPQAEAAFAYLVAQMAEETLIGMIKEARDHEPRLQEALREHGGFDNLMQAVRSHLGFAPEDTPDSLRAVAAREQAFDRERLMSAARTVSEKGTGTLQNNAKSMLEWLASDETTRAVTIDGYAQLFLTKDKDILKKFANDSLTKADAALDGVFRAEATRLLSLSERLESLAIAQGTEALFRFSLRMGQAYAQKKQAHAVLDYDDLISRAQNLLARQDVGPWVLFKLDGGIDHILVDESQDTSPAQWKIIRALADEYFSGQSARSDRTRTLFVVGDEKQSIYSFLKADPEAFAQMRAYFETRIAAAGKRLNKVPLNVSFRSAPAVLRAVDAVFHDERVRHGVSEVPVLHKAFRETGAGRVEVWPLYVPPEEQQKGKPRISKPEDWALPLVAETVRNPAAELASAIARQIRMWVETGVCVYDRELKAERPMTPGDVMVIVARRKPFVDHFVRALKEVGVPVSGVDRMRLTEQLAVMDVIALLQFALLPEDSLTLATVLRGPLIGADEEDLMALAINRTGSLWQSLRANSQTPSFVQEGDEAALVGDVIPDRSARARDRRGTYHTWREYLQSVANLADQIPPLELISHILSGPCPANAVSGRRAIAARLGPDAEDPLDELLSEAEAFSVRHSPSLQAFLHWLMSTQSEIKREMEQAMGRVRVTTVHSSKGLEAPVVILPDTARPPDRRRIPKIVWHDEHGLPFYVPRAVMNASMKSLRESAYDKQLQEHRRLLYVALTRAADRLYIGGFVTKDKPDEGKETWYNLVVQGLKAHHQDDVPADADSVLTPSFVLADYAVAGRIVKPSLSENKTCQPPIASSAHEEGRASHEGISVPAWLFAPPVPEPTPPQPLVPSRPDQEDPPSISPQDKRFARGRIIHRLLQSLPDLAEERREPATRRFLANPKHGLSLAEQEEAAQEVLALIRDTRFSPLFGPLSRAEVPLVGRCSGRGGDRLIAGQVDRLALVGQEVWVVDYKTNRPPPSDPSGIAPVYRSQMEAYRTVLMALYPQKRIRCFLLWTYTLALMEVD